MGCILCNIMNCGYKPKLMTDSSLQPNPFHCKSEEEREEFLDELAGDIVSRHPEMVQRINTLIAKTAKAK